jgi:class 3 adenylate cyclase
MPMTAPPRSVCVLFADVSGSTRLYERLGDAEALRAVERCLHRAERATVSHGGRVVKTIGDEIMAVFDSAEAGARAAGEIQQRVYDLPPVSGIKLAIRIGFHFGPAIEENGDVFGDTVNVAARMTGIAKAGQIITTADCLERLPPAQRQETREIDVLAVRGKADDIRVHELIWQDSAELTMKSASIAPPTVPAGARLKLRYGKTELIMGPARPRVALGRDDANDLVIRDPRASRSHGCIEQRRDRFVLVDMSTNGTYVTFQGEPELALKREETMLRGCGRIVFGHAWSPGVTEVVEFAVDD